MNDSEWMSLVRLCLAFVTVWTTLGLQSVSAQSNPQINVQQYELGVFVRTPSDTTYSKRNGLRLTVDSRWTNNFGFRPMRVWVTSRRPTKAEHRITFRLRISPREQPALEIEQSFDMPRGATEAETIVRIPQFYIDGPCQWDVWVDGERDRELSAGEAQAWDLNALGSPQSIATRLKFMIVKPDARPGDLQDMGYDPITAVTLALDDLPTHWIDYSPVDVVALAPSELVELDKTRPEAMTALRRWIRAGGQLWVYSVGDDWEHVEDVERILSLTEIQPMPALDIDVPEPTSAADRAVFGRGWKPISIGPSERPRSVSVQHVPTGSVRTIDDPATIARLKLDPDYIIKEEPVTDAPAASSETTFTDSTRWYLQRPAGLGQVRIFRQNWDLIGFSIAWRMLGGGAPNQSQLAAEPPTPVSAAIDSTPNWLARHGMSPDLANTDFANFLVPGVGLAPVTEFRVLITLFVLVIGPLNYWLLMRANRLHLLLLTVPALALGLTAVLFSYALLSDGLSTLVRVRSFTTLDQSTGEAASWARLSYYAGLAPGNGLALPDDVAFYPILSGWDATGDNAEDDLRELRRRDGKQLLATGWLRSRVPTQFLSIRSRKSAARIQLKRIDDRLSATNKLGARIQYLAVVDELGNVFAGQAIDKNAEVELQASTHTEALSMLRDLMLVNEPQTPPELAGKQETDSNSQRRRRRMFRQSSDPEFGIERLGGNLLSNAIAGLAAPNTDSVLNVPRRSYIAVTETGPEIDLGLPDAEEAASFHVLLGNF